MKNSCQLWPGQTQQVMAARPGGGLRERMDREGPGRPGRGGAGTAGLIDTDLADASGHPDAETLPLAQLAPAPAGPRRRGRGLAGPFAGPRGLAAPLAARPRGMAGRLAARQRGMADRLAAGPRGMAGRLAPRRRGLAGQPALLTCYLAAGVAVTWPRVTYLAG